MKKTTFALFMCLLTAQAHAAFIKIKAPQVQGEIFAEGVRVTDSQAELSCRFIKEGQAGQLESEVMPWTHHQKISGSTYSIDIKAKNYWETLPGFEIKNCSYKLILIAKDKNNKSYVGDFILFGSKTEYMAPEAIQAMKEDIQELNRKFTPLHVYLEYRRGRRVLSYK